MKNLLYIIVVLLLLSFTSCEKMIFKKEVENNAVNTFEYLWKEVNEKFSFLEYKKVSWDSIYTVYQPKVYNGMSDDELFKVLGSMLNELRDGHSNLISPFNVSRFDVTKLGKENINKRLVSDNYLKSDHYSTGAFAHNFISNNEIGYISYSSFAESLVTEFEMEYILNKYKDTKGLILDLRQNGGGMGANIHNILTHFANNDKIVYTSQIKNGKGANDFTPLENTTIEVYEDDVKYLGKVAVLIDRGSYSASSYFALASLEFDNMFLVGDTTGGGLGMPNGGQLPNGWTYRFSITRTLSLDGSNYENGVPPKYTVLLDDQSVKDGIDNVIEYAVAKLKE